MVKTTNWESVETWERLVASIIASGVKLDLKTIAAFYGTTYHTLENRFRKIKKDAEALKTAAPVDEDGEVTPAPTPVKPKTPRKPKTPKKDALETVTEGRVTKTPSKKTPAKKTAVKQEATEEDRGSDRDAPAVDEFMMFN